MSWRRVAPSLFTFIVGILAWQLIAGADTSSIRIIPPPSDVIAAMIRTSDSLISQHIPQTMIETLLGMALAIVLGLFVAALLDFVPLLKRALYPLLVISQTIPVVAIAALLIIAFGFGIEPKVIVVVLYCFFPITISTIDGLTGTDPDLVALLRAMGATRAQIWRKVRFPSALPNVFSGVRIAATYCVTAAVVGEFITSNYGLGQYLRSALKNFQSDQVFAGVVIVSLLSVALVTLVNIVERLTLTWYFTTARTQQWSEPGIY